MCGVNETPNLPVGYKITMPYIGGVLSDNNYKFATRKTKPFCRMWMRELSNKVEALSIPKGDEYEIRVFGKFTDERRPDIPNLFKIIGDSLKKAKGQEGLGVDDKFFRMKDMGYEIGHWDPEIEIAIMPLVEETSAW